MNLPNKLTVLRVIMVPFFVFFMLTDVGGPANKWIALVLFCVASLTDMLDGKIARARNLVTNFGKFMDPLADKLLVCSAMICMIPSGKLAEHTNSLSASGSINFPKLVTRFLALAILPSKRSVRLAIQNSAKAIHLFAAPPTSVNIKNTKNGTIITRSTVNLFGKFMISTLLSNHILLLRLP